MRCTCLTVIRGINIHSYNGTSDLCSALIVITPPIVDQFPQAHHFCTTSANVPFSRSKTYPSTVTSFLKYGDALRMAMSSWTVSVRLGSKRSVSRLLLEQFRRKSRSKGGRYVKDGLFDLPKLHAVNLVRVLWSNVFQAFTDTLVGCAGQATVYGLLLLLTASFLMRLYHPGIAEEVCTIEIESFTCVVNDDNGPQANNSIQYK